MQPNRVMFGALKVLDHLQFLRVRPVRNESGAVTNALNSQTSIARCGLPSGGDKPRRFT